MLKRKGLLFSLILLSLLSLQCADKRTFDQTAALDNLKAEEAFTDIIISFDLGLRGFSQFYGSGIYEVMFDSCAPFIVTPNGSQWPKDILLDYDGGCTGADGIERRGKIVAQITGSYTSEFSVVTLKLEDYWYGSSKVEGEIIITNLGLNDEGNPVFSYEVKEGKLIEDEKVVRWIALRSLVWNGPLAAKSAVIDQDCEISGFAQGTSSDGHDFTASISSPLKVSNKCRWITSGIIKLLTDEVPERILDFGNGNCDGDVLLSIRNKSYSINSGF